MTYDGTKCSYNYDKLRELFHKSTDDLTEAEYAMLNTVVTSFIDENGNLKISDLEKFVNEIQSGSEINQAIWNKMSERLDASAYVLFLTTGDYLCGNANGMDEDAVNKIKGYLELNDFLKVVTKLNMGQQISISYEGKGIKIVDKAPTYRKETVKNPFDGTDYEKTVETHKPIAKIYKFDKASGIFNDISETATNEEIISGIQTHADSLRKDAMNVDEYMNENFVKDGIGEVNDLLKEIKVVKAVEDLAMAGYYICQGDTENIIEYAGNSASDLVSYIPIVGEAGAVLIKGTQSCLKVTYAGETFDEDYAAYLNEINTYNKEMQEFVTLTEKGLQEKDRVEALKDLYDATGMRCSAIHYYDSGKTITNNIGVNNTIYSNSYEGYLEKCSRDCVKPSESGFVNWATKDRFSD